MSTDEHVPVAYQVGSFPHQFHIDQEVDAMPRTTWDLRLRALAIFIESEGGEPSTRAAVAGERRLALWLQEQRHAAHSGRLTEERLAQFKGAGLLSDDSDRVARGTSWRRVLSVSDFVAEEGRLPSVEAATSAGEKRLALWVRSQLASASAAPEVATALSQIIDRESIVAGAPNRTLVPAG